MAMRCGGKDEIGLKQLIHLLHEGGFLSGADLLVDHLSVFEEEDGGDVTDTVFGHDGVVLVYIDLTDGDAAGVFLGQFIDDGADHAAGTTPFGPKVKYYRLAGC